MRTKRRLALAAVVAGLAAWLAWAFRPEAVPVELARVARGPLVVTVDEDARTRVVDRFVVHAPLAGELRRVTLRPGDAVARGDVLARIVPRQAPLLDARQVEEAESRVRAARAAVDAARARTRGAEADLELARRELARVRPLAEGGQLPAARLDEATSLELVRAATLESERFSEHVALFDLRQAEAALLPRGLQGGELHVLSPLAARVLRVLEVSEGPVEAGQHLVELGDPARLEVVVDMLSSEAVAVPVGARAVLEGWGGAPLEGRVRRVEPAATTKVSALGIEEQRVDVLLDLVGPPTAWAGLGDGYALDARIVTSETDDALVVPAAALWRAGDQWAVFVVVDGRARRRAVEVGHRTGREAEVLSGLVENETVIVHPDDTVEDGARVRERGADQ